METFEVSVKKAKNLPKNFNEEEEGSEIEDDDILSIIDDDDDEDILEYLQKAFNYVSDVTKISTGEYMLDFYEPNAKLSDDESDYDFDICDNIPTLYETEQFIPFVNFIRDHEPALIGSTLYTNLEGGGHLVI